MRNGRPWYQENTPLRREESEHGVSDSAQRVCPISWCVCRREKSVQHNGVLQCGRPLPFLPAPLHGLLSGPSKLPWQDFKRKGRMRKDGGGGRDIVDTTRHTRSEIPNVYSIWKKIRSKRGGKRRKQTLMNARKSERFDRFSALVVETWQECGDR